MTTIAVQKLAELRQSIAKAEEMLGLNELSYIERDLYYAAADLVEKEPTFRTAELIDHTLTKPIPRPTFFRALKKLTQSGYLVQCPDCRGRYSIKDF